MKTFQFSDELHAALKDRAAREGRSITTIVTIAVRKQMGPREFPKGCREWKLLPENLR